MDVTRRAFARGSAAVAAAALMPARAGSANIILVRRPIDALTGEKSPLIDSYRRAVHVMMQRDITDKTSWWFQANIHAVAAAEITDSVKPLSKYWRQVPQRTHFFLSWQRTYLYFLERILRRACGDPVFALPYWGYDDAGQGKLPAALRPGADLELPPSARPNALARAKRRADVDRGTVGLGDLAADINAALACDHFAAAGPLGTRRSLGGVRVADPGQPAGAGALEAISNLVLTAIGRDGDLGSPTTAARDPLFHLHLANIDRLWVKWTDAARGRIPPIADEVWMKTAFTFVDENGDDRHMTAADILDTQHQLGYRYDDDPERTAPLAMAAASAAVAVAPVDEIVLARGRGVELSARESHLVLAPVPRPRGKSDRKRLPKGQVAARPRLYIVLRDVDARDRTPPYDIYLVLEGPNVFQATTASVPLGALDLYGGVGNGRNGPDEGFSIAFDATAAIAKLGKVRGYNLRHLRVSIVRRALAAESGGKSVPSDPAPPTIGTIELVQA